MPKLDQFFPSNYLRSSDLQGRRVTVTISHITSEDVGDDKDKPVLYFRGKEKGLVLNKTNASAIADIVGSDDTDDWGGHQVVMFPTRVDFKGKMTDAIRIDRAPSGGTAARPAQVRQVQRAPEPEPDPAQADSTGFDDEVPF